MKAEFGFLKPIADIGIGTPRHEKFCESDDGHWSRAEAIFPEKPVEIQRIIEKSK